MLLIHLSPSLSCLGHLSPPLQLSSSPETVATLQLRWKPPFSLQREKISYLLHARNLRTNIMIGKVVSGTWTTFKRPRGDQVCDRYEFTVYSNNAVGLSDSFTAVNATTPSGKQLSFGNVLVKSLTNKPWTFHSTLSIFRNLTLVWGNDCMCINIQLIVWWV